MYETDAADQVTDTGAERPAEDSFDEQALEDKIGAGLDALNAGEDVNEAMEAASEDETEESDDSGHEAEIDDSADEADDTPDETADLEAAEDDDSSASPTLPDAYRRSLHAYGWEDEAIDQNLEALGGEFIRTAERLHENRSRELQSFADLGRKIRDDGQSPEEAVRGEQPNAGSDAPGMLSPIDVEALKEKYGDDEMLNEIVGPVNQAINKMNAMVPGLQNGQEAVNSAAMQQLEQVVNNFFTSPELKQYEDLYGGANPSKDEQVQMRNKVLEVADAIAYGTKAQGRGMSVDEALEAAHGIVSSEFRGRTERKKIKDGVEKRNKGTTLRPSGRKSSKSSQADKPSGPAKTEEELLDRVGQNMAAVFGTNPS